MSLEIDEDLHLLGWASEEIRSLRRRNEVLEAKVETMDLLGRFLDARLPAQGGMAYGEDIVSRLQKRIEEKKAPKPQQGNDESLTERVARETGYDQTR